MTRKRPTSKTCGVPLIVCPLDDHDAPLRLQWTLAAKHRPELDCEEHSKMKCVADVNYWGF
jgi:hypothetical protein